MDALEGSIGSDLVRLIIDILIGIMDCPDIIIWPWTPNGSYSVGSRYHRAHIGMTINISVSDHSSHRVDDVVWKELWNLKTLPRLDCLSGEWW